MNKRDEPLADARIRAALAKALNSPQLSSSARLQDFLTYVVEESLHGRGGAIVGKIIAQDVYGRDPTEGGDNVVRVDARRLRRALAEYYGADGANDPVRIHIDKGQYAPRFEAAQQQPDRPDVRSSPVSARRLRLFWPILLVCGGMALAVGFLMALEKMPTRRLSEASGDAAQERLALAAKSMATLQASNLARKANELLFPIVDIEHQKSATLIFQDAIRIDPEFAGGYAGAAHSLSTLAILAPDENRRQDLLQEALIMANTATDLDPTNGWAISSQAWLAFAQEDRITAQTLADRAYRLSDMDAHVLDFSALIFLLSGEFETAQRIADPDMPRVSAGLHQAHLNIYGVASFHLGQYEHAVSAFDRAIASGGPVSEFTLLFKAASCQANNQHTEAKELLLELSRVWPDFNPETALQRFYISPDHVDAVLRHLTAAGWPENMQQ